MPPISWIPSVITFFLLSFCIFKNLHVPKLFFKENCVVGCPRGWMPGAVAPRSHLCTPLMATLHIYFIPFFCISSGCLLFPSSKYDREPAQAEVVQIFFLLF